MKKSKIITGLSAAFVAVIALASCNNVKANGDVVLRYDGVDYTANDLFKDQRGAATGEAKFNAVYKVAVRQWAKNGDGKQYADTVKKETQIKISGQKDVAQSNANKNGTSYDTEWNKILKSNNVDDEQGLYDKFEYEIQKTKFDDDFYEKKLEILKQGGYLKDSTPSAKDPQRTDSYINGYMNKKQPYHVKHILVKVSAAAGDAVTGEITEAEAVKLSTVIQNLANGEDFGTVAFNHSDDTTSAKNYGDLGIMDRDTSFVNEFKLGIYLYESYFGKSTSETGSDPQGQTGHYNHKEAKLALGLNDITTEEQAGKYANNASTLLDPSGAELNTTTEEGQGIGQIPYEAALALGDENWTVKKKDDETKTLTGKGYAKIQYGKDNNPVSKVTSEDKAKYYPRNVIFNKYFNKNNIMVITPRTMPSHGVVASTFVNTYVSSDGKTRISDDKYKGSLDNEGVFKSLPGFSQNIKNGDELLKKLYNDGEQSTGGNKTILRDKEGRTILVFRSGTTGDSSYQGIHFVCIERSPFIGKEYVINNGSEYSEAVTSDEYFTYYYPNQVGHENDYPTYKEDGALKGQAKNTYVNYIKGLEESELKTRTDTVKSKIKSHDSNLNTYVYEYLIDNGQIKFNDKSTIATGVKDSITTWIKAKRDTTEYEAKNTWNDTWKTYYNKLDAATRARKPAKIADNDYVGGTISEACAIAYAEITDQTVLKQLFDKGGVFNG